MFCRNCGKQIPDGCAFCIECGTKLEGATSSQVLSPAPTTVSSQVLSPASAVMPTPAPVPVTTPAGKPPKKKKTGLIVALILIFVFVAAAVVGVFLFLNSDSRKFDKLLASAEELIDDEEYEDAVDVLEEALEIKEDDEDAIDLLIEAYEAMAEAYEEDGKYDKAEKIYKKIDKLTGEDDSDKKPGKEQVQAVPSDGKVLNIYSWNDEFQRRVKDHYPGYEEIDYSTGRIGDVTVRWNITPSYDNAYQNYLDSTLRKQRDAAADDKIDIFLVEADYALKYVDSEYTLPISSLGITQNDIADQYKYTQEIVTDSNGVLKALSWQGCPGILYYNREIAKEIFGTDDPAVVQANLKDWDTFLSTAQYMRNAGYSMVSSVYDTYRTYENNRSSKWVVDGKINIDANIMKWVDDSKYLVDLGVAGTHDLWTDAWSKGFYPEGNVFCYLGPAWMINFSMASDVNGSLANIGGWAGTEGPQASFWGGTWICAATGTDNAELIKDIMLKLTTDTELMKGIVMKDDDFVNNASAMNALCQSDYRSNCMGGQNPLPMYCANAHKLDMSYVCAYDQGINEEFQKAMRGYFEGTLTKEEALELFYRGVIEKYPELSK